MAAVSTEKWIKFFTRAGIPPRAAATYALTFADNRIQLDMLLDLNKEYLRDMGITLMGDVIAILRHARQVHEELTHEKLLSHSKSRSLPSTVKPVVNVKESTDVTVSSKMVKPAKSDRVPSKSTSSSSFNSSSTSAQSSPVPSPAKKGTIPSRISDASTRQSSASRSTPANTFSLPHASSSEKIINKRVEPQTESLKRRSGEISRPKISVESDDDVQEVPVPAKKVRRVLPEHEGGYKIKMPSGSTPRSQQILAKQKEINKKTVFDRLGRSSSPGGDPLVAAVSSTTSDPTFTVTGLEVPKTAKISSVFSRLGDKQVSSTSAPVKEELKYAGILKSTSTSTKPIQKQTVALQKTSSMVADSVINVNRKDMLSRIGSGKQVVGVKRTATVVSVPKVVKVVKTAGILAGYSGDVDRTVKSRLGSEDLARLSQISGLKHVSKPTLTPVPKRQTIQPPQVNGSVLSSYSKRVTFSSTPGPVSSVSGVFSRLGR